VVHSHQFCSIFQRRIFRHKAQMPEDLRHNLRLPAALKKRLAHSAVDAGRSMNAEILARLEGSFTPQPMREIETILRGMASLSDADRQKVAELLSGAAAILSKR
jgi:hypothetical protein